MTTLILAVSASIGISFLCSVLEAVLYSTRVITLEAAEHAGVRQAAAMRRFKHEVDRPLAAILTLNTLAHTIGAAVAGWAAGALWGAHSLWIFSLAYTIGVLVFSEIIPKVIGTAYWRGLWRVAVPPLGLMTAFFTPVIWLTRALTRLITRHKAEAVLVSEDEIVAAARLGHSGGEISKMEADMINNIIGLEQVTAGTIMTPRTVMLTMDGDQPVAEVQAGAKAWPHTRVPVWVDSPDNVVGYVIKDDVCTLEPTPDQPGPALKDLAKPVRFVPHTANALNLLNFFLKRREHIYLVVDEYGGVMGLVTLEDVLESLVGSEIVDEKDIVADMQELARRRGRAWLKQRGEDA